MRRSPTAAGAKPAGGAVPAAGAAVGMRLRDLARRDVRDEPREPRKRIAAARDIRGRALDDLQHRCEAPRGPRRVGGRRCGLFLRARQILGDLVPRVALFPARLRAARSGRRAPLPLDPQCEQRRPPLQAVARRMEPARPADGIGDDRPVVAVPLGGKEQGFVLGGGPGKALAEVRVRGRLGVGAALGRHLGRAPLRARHVGPGRRKVARRHRRERDRCRCRQRCLRRSERRSGRGRGLALPLPLLFRQLLGHGRAAGRGPASSGGLGSRHGHRHLERAAHDDAAARRGRGGGRR
jgi:hypothetical protein